VAADVQDGWVINLGVGQPVAVAEFLERRPVLVHSENGILGMGPRPAPGDEDPDLVDAGKSPVTMVPGAAIVDSAVSFALIRGGRLDLSIMGAYQVSDRGDLANWRLPDRKRGAIGGAADLVVGAQRVWIMTTHTSRDGSPKLVATCTYPLTAERVATRVYTDLAVLDVEPGGFVVRRMAPGVTADQVQANTDGRVVVPD
jgi:3-oxoacid CoA-transferase B subunit